MPATLGVLRLATPLTMTGFKLVEEVCRRCVAVQTSELGVFDPFFSHLQLQLASYLPSLTLLLKFRLRRR